jgi:hypothetical protein
MTGSRRHVLYRFWDCDDQLLYVGLTANPGSRWKAHGVEKPWWIDVARVTVEHFASRAEAEAAEATAIKTEGPLYNVRHVPVTMRELTSAEFEQKKTVVSVRMTVRDQRLVSDRAQQADVDFSHMIRRMLAYADQFMPDGWLPVAGAGRRPRPAGARPASP